MYQEIPLNQLIFSAQNVRSMDSSKKADSELIAGIASQGVLQNLIVIPNKSKFEVVAGGRRLAALMHLVTHKEIDFDMPVGCQVRDAGENLTEISLMENVQREAMHPADEFEAYRKMIEDDGLDVSDVAERSGKSRTYVKQRLSLGSVCPKLLGYYRKGKITLDAIMAFTLSNDHKRQQACYKELSSSHRLHPHGIKNWLAGEAVVTSNGIGKFVGKAAYLSAGGLLNTDLFEDVVYLSDSELVTKLAMEKLDKAAAKLSGDGWLWVTPTLLIDSVSQEFDVVNLVPVLAGVPKALTAKIKKLDDVFTAIDAKCREEGWPDELDKEFDKAEEALQKANDKQNDYLTYTAEQKSYSGCFVGFDGAGKLRLRNGIAFKKDVPQPKESESVKTAGDKAKEPAVKGVSMALNTDLGNYRQQATKAALVAQTSIAMDILHYSVCVQVLVTGYHQGRNLLDMDFKVASSRTSKEDIEDMPATTVINAALEKLDTEWLAIKDEAKRFDKFCGLSKAVKDKLVTYCVAKSLTISSKGANKEQDCVVDKLKVPFAEYWKPTKENYFSRLSLKLLIESVGKLRGKTWANAAKTNTQTKAKLVEHVVEWSETPEGKAFIPTQF